MQKIINWLKKQIVWILFAIFLFCMIVCFISGCRYHKNHFPCPGMVINTVILHDTIIHEIIDTFPYYIVKNDTIIYSVEIPATVDTVKILADYFALHVYSRSWKDTLLEVEIKDTVTQNRFKGNDFQYKILMPQMIINKIVDNSITFNKYLYLGLDIPFKEIEYAEIEALFAFNRGFLGFSYAPLMKGISLNTGFRVAKFR